MDERVKRFGPSVCSTAELDGSEVDVPEVIVDFLESHISRIVLTSYTVSKLNET
jgi:hypothetical protein